MGARVPAMTSGSGTSSSAEDAHGSPSFAVGIEPDGDDARSRSHGGTYGAPGCGLAGHVLAIVLVG